MRGLGVKEISLGLALILSTGACATMAEAQKDEIGITIQEEQDEARDAVNSTCDDFSHETRVTKVIDGDTIDVICGDVVERIRIIGIDTPETVHPRKPVQCYGREASDRMKALLSGKRVLLRQGQGSGNRGKYGRLLRYVELDRTDVGAQLISDGYAFAYKRFPHERLDEYTELERKARESEAGLWAKDACADEYEDAQ